MQSTGKTLSRNHGRIIADVLVMCVIAAFGWFLIGYYGQFQYLVTGQQDWMNQASQVQSLERYGPVSWEHRSSNGMSTWRSSLYLWQYLLFGTTKISDLSITQSMLVWSVGIFISIRLMLYLALRFLGIRPIFAATVTIFSYTYAQEWTMLGDFSLYLGNVFLIPYLLLWIKTLNNEKYLPILAASTGLYWLIHPVFGYTVTGLLIFIFLVNGKYKEWRVSLSTLGIFLLSSAPVSVPMFLSGYQIPILP